MADPAQIQQMLQNLQSQIATIASITGQVVPQQPTVSPSFQPQPDISALVKSAVAAEMSKQRVQTVATAATPAPAAPTSQPALPPPVPASKMESLLPIIGAAFSPEQQVWLSQPANLLGLPGFLMTHDGRNVLVQALESYQRFVNGSV